MFCFGKLSKKFGSNKYKNSTLQYSLTLPYSSMGIFLLELLYPSFSLGEGYKSFKKAVIKLLI